MRVTKKPEERKNEILDAAELLFSTEGYSKTTIKDILDRVGIAKGTFYYYFQSKEEVMDAVIMRFISSGVEGARSVAQDSSLSAPEKLFHIITGGKKPSREEQIIDELHQIDNAEMHQKSLIEMIHQLTPVITDVIEEGITEGSFHTPYPKETVELLLVSFQFLFDEGIFQWQSEDLVQKAKAMAHNMELLLGAEKGSFHYIAEMYENTLED